MHSSLPIHSFWHKPFFRKEVILLNYRKPIRLIFFLGHAPTTSFGIFSSFLFLLSNHLNRISIVAKRSFRNPIRILLRKKKKKNYYKAADTINSIQLSVELLCLSVCSLLNGNFKVRVCSTFDLHLKYNEVHFYSAV